MATQIVSSGTADTYFETRLGASAYWVSGADKDAALMTAQNQLATIYDLDSTDEEHLNAICEQALYLLRNTEGADGRADLAAGGVTAAGFMEESYDKDRNPLGICAYAQKALAGAKLSRATAGGAILGTISRDDSI